MNNRGEELDYPKEKTRRIMARVALRRLSKLAAEVREEGVKNAVAAKRIALWIGVSLIVLCLLPTVYWAIFEAHEKIRLFASSLLIGLFFGIGLVIWGKWQRQAPGSNIPVNLTTESGALSERSASRGCRLPKR